MTSFLKIWWSVLDLKSIRSRLEVICHLYNESFGQYSRSSILLRHDNILFKSDNFWSLDEDRLHGTTYYSGGDRMKVRHIGFSLETNEQETSMVVEICKGFVYKPKPSIILVEVWLLKNPQILMQHVQSVSCSS